MADHRDTLFTQFVRISGIGGVLLAGMMFAVGRIALFFEGTMAAAVLTLVGMGWCTSVLGYDFPRWKNQPWWHISASVLGLIAWLILFLWGLARLLLIDL